MVQHLNVQRGQPLVITERFVFEHCVATQSQIGRVDLQHQPGFDNGFIFKPHGFRQRLEIAVVRRIMIVRLKQGDNARRGRVHEGVAAGRFC